eukprot:344698-Chlamydomonas_euryale.AAC.2
MSGHNMRGGCSPRQGRKAKGAMKAPQVGPWCCLGPGAGGRGGCDPVMDAYTVELYSSVGLHRLPPEPLQGSCSLLLDLGFTSLCTSEGKGELGAKGSTGDTWELPAESGRQGKRATYGVAAALKEPSAGGRPYASLPEARLSMSATATCRVARA